MTSRSRIPPTKDRTHARQRSPHPRQPGQRQTLHGTRRPPRARKRSRANALKHGLTGAGIVLPEADAAEVERRAAAFAAETNASGEIGQALARLAALNSVRIERGADQQTAALAEHVRRVEAEFVPPEGVDEADGRPAPLRGGPPGHVRPVEGGDPGPPVRGRRRTRLLPRPDRSCAGSRSGPGPASRASTRRLS